MDCLSFRSRFSREALQDSIETLLGPAPSSSGVGPESDLPRGGGDAHPGSECRAAGACGAQFTASRIRAHFTISRSGPAASAGVDRRGESLKPSVDAHQAANAVDALRSPTHGEPDADALGCAPI